MKILHNDESRFRLIATIILSVIGIAALFPLALLIVASFINQQGLSDYSRETEPGSIFLYDQAGFYDYTGLWSDDWNNRGWNNIKHTPDYFDCISNVKKAIPI